MKIVFLDTETFGDAFDVKQFEPLGEIKEYAFTSEREIKNRIANAQVIITNKVRIDREVIDHAISLRLICIAATGKDHVDVEYAASKDIIVKNAVNYSTESVAEITLSFILALKNRITYYDHYVTSGAYEKNNTFTHIGSGFNLLTNNKVGIVGLGNIGRKVAEICDLLGAKVAYYSVSNKQQKGVNYEYYDDFKTFLSSCDIISLHCPLSPASVGLMNKETFKSMKKSSLLINVSRGPVVVTEDLVEAILVNQIGGFATDVYDVEPLKENSLYKNLFGLKNVLFSPHIAWASIEARMILLDIIEGHIKSVVK